MTNRFADRLTAPGIIFFDGAMGTELAARGAHVGAVATLETPQAVADVHAAYRQAGAQVLLTNTFSANRISLAREKMQDRLEEIVRKSVALARQAAGKDGFIAGDIGSTGDYLEPVGNLAEAEASAAFEETARALAAAGVDLFAVETFTEAREIALAIKACKRAAPGIPVAATMSFDPVRGGYRTNAGVTPADAAQAMVDAGADMVGANCGSTVPEQMAEIVSLMRARVRLPILIKANAGKPELQAGRTIFRLSPDAFAKGMKRVIDAGAKGVGGCCGTTPAHIQALHGLAQNS